MTGRPLCFGIAGNPNCGKTTLFNALTGARQRVGNWPGVTVERKTGTYRDGATAVEVIDLPGVYTLGSLPGMDSLDEHIAQDAIARRDMDVVINVVDAANLERNLYLTAQLLEMRVPVVVALNMMDRAGKQGLAIDAAHLSNHLGCPVVPIVASRNKGIADLKAAVRETAAVGRPPTAELRYGAGVEDAIATIVPHLDAGLADRRWLAVKLLEGDSGAEAQIGGAVRAMRDAVVTMLEDDQGEDADMLIADARYAFANTLANHVVRRVGAVGRDMSDLVDRVVLNRWLGLPIFLGLMYLMFMVTINLGGAFIDVFDLAAAAVFVDGFGAVLTWLGSPDWLRVVLADGLGGGIQVVATFIPIIGFLYLFLSVLEDTGYMARAAFLMDRAMRRIGLPGKAFVPLIVGFGCNVPAIMASRTLEQQRDRTLSVMMTPFMSCGARLAVYALFAAAFFPAGGQNVVFALYLIGVSVAIATGFLLKHTLLKGETTPFVMELPAYHLPTMRSVVLHAWNRLQTFLFGAGKVIVAVVMVLSVFNSLGSDGSFGNEDSDRSVLSAIGRTIVPAFEPMGIRADNWPATVGIFTGIFAKEAVVGTLDALYGAIDAPAAGIADEEDAFDLWGDLAAAVATVPGNMAGLTDLITDPLGIGAAGVDSPDAAAEAQGISDGTFGAMVARFDGTAGAFAYLLLILLYTPCVAALGAVNRELGPRWTLFAAAWTSGISYVTAVGFYQAATFSRHPAASAAWLIGLATVLATSVAVLRRAGHRPSESVPFIAPAE